ncbi:PAP-associated domain-containing protein [Plasmodiophora brassicae]|uniref:Uncharacterized protein n=1 Tax=Plasmodiophora brassicae TaxID=37360 RepID=A0A0G4ISZ4_PLABS|nr:hypothetical protein PBRA_006330 [Plasmodiophora brassicae]
MLRQLRRNYSCRTVQSCIRNMARWNAMRVVIVVAVLAWAVDVQAAKRRARRRATQESRVDHALPLSPTPEIRDAILLLEQARVTICEAESLIRQPIMSGVSEVAPAIPDNVPRHRLASYVVDNAHSYERNIDFDAVVFETLVTFASFLDDLGKAAFQIETNALESRDAIPDANRLIESRRAALSSAWGLSNQMSSLLRVIMDLHESKFEDLPSLRFWNSSGVTPDEIVSATAQMNEQADLVSEMAHMFRQRNALLELGFAVYSEHCDLVSHALTRPMVAATLRIRLQAANNTKAFEDLVNAAELNVFARERIADRSCKLKMANDRLDLALERVELVHLIVERIRFLMDLVASPSSFRGLPDPAPSSKKTKKKKPVTDTPVVCDAEASTSIDHCVDCAQPVVASTAPGDVDVDNLTIGHDRDAERDDISSWTKVTSRRTSRAESSSSPAAIVVRETYDHDFPPLSSQPHPARRARFCNASTVITNATDCNRDFALNVPLLSLLDEAKKKADAKRTIETTRGSCDDTPAESVPHIDDATTCSRIDDTNITTDDDSGWVTVTHSSKRRRSYMATTSSRVTPDIVVQDTYDKDFPALPSPPQSQTQSNARAGLLSRRRQCQPAALSAPSSKAPSSDLDNYAPVSSPSSGLRNGTVNDSMKNICHLDSTPCREVTTAVNKSGWRCHTSQRPDCAKPLSGAPLSPGQADSRHFPPLPRPSLSSDLSSQRKPSSDRSTGRTAEVPSRNTDSLPMPLPSPVATSSTSNSSTKDSSVMMPPPGPFRRIRKLSLDSQIAPHIKAMTLARSQDFQLTADLLGFVASSKKDRQSDSVYHRQGYRAVKQAVRLLFPGGTVRLTGSIASGLHLPAPASDLDIVVRHPTVHWSIGLLQLFVSIRGNPSLSSVKYIPTASTPIIKATIANASVNVDITWNVANVDESRHFIMSAMNQYPLFKPLTMYMKHYLYMYGLGNPYYGGLGSFPLYLLVIFHLQANSAACSQSAGACLRAFFGYYGFAFRIDYDCISVHTNGRPLSKIERVHRGPLDITRLCIESPFDVTVDVGRSAFNFAAIRRQFHTTFRTLASSWKTSLANLTPDFPLDPATTMQTPTFSPP